MNILTHGTTNKQKYKIECYKCGCVFTYAEKDRHGYDNLYKDEFVTCPECNKWLKHSKSKDIKE